MPLKERTSATPMLRELRRNLLLKISHGQKRVPTISEIRRWRLEEYRLNPTVADLYSAILLTKQDLVLSEDELPSLATSIRLASLLEDRPLPKNSFASISLTDGLVHGVLIQLQHLQVGGLVYAVTIFNLDGAFDMVSRAEVRACNHEPEPYLTLQTTAGWIQISKSEAHENKQAIFILRCLAAQHEFKYRSIPISEIEVSPNSPSPPTNKFALNLIKDAYLNKIFCTKVLIQLDRIEPENLAFALQVSPEIIRESMTYVVDSGCPSIELLLYEKEGKLLMSDDYPIYLAYRALLFKEVPAVIIGEFNKEGIKIIREGYSELMPPVVTTHAKSCTTKLIVEDQKKLLLDKLASLTPKESGYVNHFESLYISFSRLLADHKTAERDLHRFISNHPVIFDGHLASIYSEVCIGNYRADLVLRYEQLDKKILLIELERHDDLIFKRSNRLRDKVNHAVQQVEDWISAIRKGATPIPKWLDESYTPEGCVVIGRSKDLTSVQQKTLFDINSNRLVKVITYDDLLERMKQLIEMLARQNL